jgi:hypothetical protein
MQRHCIHNNSSVICVVIQSVAITVQSINGSIALVHECLPSRRRSGLRFTAQLDSSVLSDSLLLPIRPSAWEKVASAANGMARLSSDDSL